MICKYINIPKYTPQQIHLYTKTYILYTMFSLKESLPNEKKENEEQLIEKYKAYSMEYLKYKYKKVDKKINAGYTLICGIIFIELLYLTMTLISGASISKNMKEITTNTAANFSNASVANVFIESGEFNIYSNVICIGCILGIILVAYILFIIFTKYNKEQEFYDKVIDIKMDEAKL